MNDSASGASAVRRRSRRTAFSERVCPASRLSAGSSEQYARPVAYDEELAERMRDRLEGELAVVEKRMFGGLAFMIDGNLSVIASGSGGGIFRIDPEDEAVALQREHTANMEVKGRPMPGWIRVDSIALADDDVLDGWVADSLEFVRTLPPK